MTRTFYAVVNTKVSWDFTVELSKSLCTVLESKCRFLQLSLSLVASVYTCKIDLV